LPLVKDKNQSPNDWQAFFTEQGKIWVLESTIEKKDTKTTQIANKIYNIGSADNSVFN